MYDSIAANETEIGTFVEQMHTYITPKTNPEYEDKLYFN
jgi:hypothetical protein